MTIVNRIIWTLVSNKRFRGAGGRLYSFVGMMSSASGVDPIVEIPLQPFGIDARLAMHLLNRDMTSLVEVFVNQVYDRFCPLMPGDTVIDCGAYIGEFALHAAKKVGNEGLVLAFEPNPPSFALCKRNIERNGAGNVKLFSSALGKVEDVAHIEPVWTNLGAAKIVPYGSKNGISISVKTLAQFDSFLEGREVRLLKLDVEGSAVDIVEGASILLRKKLIENIVAEIHPGEEGLSALLKSHGFRCLREGSYLYASLDDPFGFLP